MPVIRRKLDPNTVYPTTIRYNPDTDTIESNVNGDWVENPAADPRNQTTLPPRITSDPACDGAKSVSDAFAGKIAEISEAISNASTAFTIAGLLLGLLSFGVFEVFIALALTVVNGMIDAGAAAIDAALTPTVFDTFTCILFCEFNESGRLKAGAIGRIQFEISDQIGGLAAVVLGGMVQLSGEGGINNLASLGTSTGDCSSCDCGLCDTVEWSETYLGTVIERGDDYIIIQSVYNPGAYGTDRIAIGTGDPDLCCRFSSYEWITTQPAGYVYKFIPCGRPFSYGGGGEGAYTHGIPAAGDPVSTIGVDCDASFIIRINLSGY